jgi:hypothetical protein
MQLRPTVLLAVTNRRSFMQHYYDRDGTCGIWVTGNTSLDLGAQVDIEIAFAEEQLVLHSRGVVRAKRVADRSNLRAGVGIEFLPSELKTRDLIVSFTNGQADLVRRKSRRLPVVMAVELTLPTGQRTEFTENISREGALVCIADPPGPGTRLTLTLKPQGLDRTFSLAAEVRWRRLNDRPAMGVRFIFDDPTKQRELTVLLDVLRARLAG